MMAGAETVQLYVSQKNGQSHRPPKELKGFQKIMLKPGESRNVEFELNRDAFKYWDIETDGWRINPGEFEILVGSSSMDIYIRKPVALLFNGARSALPQGQLFSQRSANSPVSLGACEGALAGAPSKG